MATFLLATVTVATLLPGVGTRRVRVVNTIVPPRGALSAVPKPTLEHATFQAQRLYCTATGSIRIAANGVPIVVAMAIHVRVLPGVALPGY
eukprot:787943-Rhodomonas_salina.1